MPSLEKRGQVFRAKFRYGGRQFGCALKTADRREAQALLGRLEENLILLERGKLDVPAGADLPLFLLSDAKVAQRPVALRSVSLGELFKHYRESSNGKETSTRYTEEIHMKHLERLLGARQDVRNLGVRRLQEYVDSRAAEKGRNGTVSHATIQKEIGTFTSVWNRFAVPNGHTSGPAPSKGLVYAKTQSKPPFQTWEQIQRKIARGGLTPREQAQLWESSFLTRAQIDELLEHVKNGANADWVYPMIVFAAYTGARRSEMLRSEIDDFDFDGKSVRIREKKKDHRRDLTFRSVPITPFLAEVMRRWFGGHPGGHRTFCRETGEPITGQTATHQLARALENSKWSKVRGWHTLRHSFCSNCAAAGIDQRMISSWMGHQTPEMERRYRHLFPALEQQALARVFG